MCIERERDIPLDARRARLHSTRRFRRWAGVEVVQAVLTRGHAERPHPQSQI